MFYAIISFFGLLIGLILINKFRSELNDIKKFLKFVAFILIISIILRLFMFINFSYLFLLGMIIGGIVNYFLKNNYLYFGNILILTNFMNNINKIFFSILIFIIGLIYPVLNKINNKIFLISLSLFALPFILLLTNFNLSYNNFLLGFSIGGLAVGFKQDNK